MNFVYLVNKGGKMIKKISLFILGLISLGLINFSSAGSYTYSGSVYFNLSEGTNRRKITAVEYNIPLIEYKKEAINNQLSQVQCKITNYTSNIANTVYAYMNLQQAGGTQNSKLIGGFNGNGTYIINYSTTTNQEILLSNQFNIQFDTTNQAINLSFDRECTYIGDNIINQVDIGGGGSNCSQCESDLSSCQSLLSSANSDLSNCQSSLNNANSDLSTCQSNLSSCQSSLSGYDNTLNNCSTNLNSCNSSLSACLQSNCPVNTGDVQWSALFINDIQHIGAGIINISIPQEIHREYYNTGDSFDLDIEGYNVDTEYIEGIINTQSTLPNQVDLNNLVKVILPLFVPGLVIILFIYFIFRFIKKIF